MRFNVVTPVLNGEKFINETILSVALQSGPFSIRYHVQDGGSRDSTIELLKAWRDRLAIDFPTMCDGIEFSFCSERDRSVYDAINRGFSHCDGRDADVMAWINADDRFEPGAFMTVATIFKNNSRVDWLTGRPTVITENGECLWISQITPFPRKAIAAGIFDGRFARPFIQQEGTFWRPKLWKEAGGVDIAFRLAGDFDLWRRFARGTDLVVVDAILGCFRTRPGQLSENMASYHAEIDSSMDAEAKKIRSRASDLYRRNQFSYPLMFRHYGSDWTHENWRMGGIRHHESPGFTIANMRLRVADFFGGLFD
jgi:glycosyltransferase involved in cell wall biosynthesis